MLIKSITIQNFLCYYGTDNRFDFSEGLNLVLGANGYGKSKLYDAFQWVISDQITDNSPNNKTGMKGTGSVKRELVSEKALYECEVGGIVETKIILEVEDSGTNPKTYQLIRSYTLTKKDDTHWHEPPQSKFSIHYKDVIHFKPLSESEFAGTLEKLLPTDVRPYVWFQGERGINNLIDTSSSESLRNVIKRLSDIDRWDKYIAISQKAYETAKNAFEGELRKSQKNQDKIKELQKQKNEIQKNIDQIDIQIFESAKNLKASQAGFDALSASIENATILNKTKGEEENLVKELRKTENEIDAFYQNFNKKMFSNFWVLMGTENLIEKFEAKYQAYNDIILDRKAQENLLKKIEEQLQTRLPEGVPEPMYIQTMLEKEHCLVCDRPAAKDSDAYLAIKQLLPTLTPKSTQPNMQRLDGLFRMIYQNGLSLKDKIVGANDDIKENLIHLNTLTQRKKGLEEDLDAKSREIQEQLRISGLSNPKDIINSFEVTNRDLQKYSREKGGFENQRIVKETALARINEELDRLSEGEISPILKQKRDLLLDLFELSKRVKKRKYQELVQLLEDTTNHHYRNINAPTGAFYGDIRFIDTGENGYRPSVIDKSNRDVTGSLNTSLVSSMKLSIIMAIVSANKTRNYANFYPLISDAPVSDFDVVKTRTFLKETADTFKQSIIIFKEMLIEDPERDSRYIPDYDRLHELKELVEESGQKITTYQIDMPDGISNKFRNEIEITIKKIEC